MLIRPKRGLQGVDSDAVLLGVSRYEGAEDRAAKLIDVMAVRAKDKLENVNGSPSSYIAAHVWDTQRSLPVRDEYFGRACAGGCMEPEEERSLSELHGHVARFHVDGIATRAGGAVVHSCASSQAKRDSDEKKKRAELQRER